MLIAFAQFPVEDSEPIRANTLWGSFALGGISLILIASSLFSFFRDEGIKKKLAQKNEELESKKEELYCLDQSVQRLKDFLEENLNDDTRVLYKKVIDILEGTAKNVSDFSSKYSYRKSAADWVKTNTNKWLMSLRIEDYSEYGVNRKNFDDFKSDLEKHLELLCENILEARNSAPLMVNPPVPQRIGTPILYEKALKEIERLAYQELLSGNALKMHSDEILRAHMSTLIEFLNYTS